MGGKGGYYSPLGECHYPGNTLSYGKCSQSAVITEQLNLAKITLDLKEARNGKVANDNKSTGTLEGTLGRGSQHSF